MWIDASRRVSEYSVDTVEIWYSPAICNNEVQCSSIVCRAWIHRALPVSHPWKCFYDSENRQTSAVSPCLPPLYPIMNIDYAVHSVVQTTDQYRPQCTIQCSAYIITDPKGGRSWTLMPRHYMLWAVLPSVVSVINSLVCIGVQVLSE